MQKRMIRRQSSLQYFSNDPDEAIREGLDIFLNTRKNFGIGNLSPLPAVGGPQTSRKMLRGNSKPNNEVDSGSRRKPILFHPISSSNLDGGHSSMERSSEKVSSKFSSAVNSPVIVTRQLPMLRPSAFLGPPKTHRREQTWEETKLSFREESNEVTVESLVKSGTISQGRRQRYVMKFYEQMDFVQRLTSTGKTLHRVEGVIVGNNKVLREKASLILDLFHTVVCPAPDNTSPDISFDILRKGKKRTFNMVLRPYLYEFLEQLDPFYEFFVFSDKSPELTEAIVRAVDPKALYFNGVFSKKNCGTLEYGSEVLFVKDLNIFLNRTLRRIILLDDSLLGMARKMTMNCAISFLSSKLPLLLKTSASISKHINYNT
eukprot:TRINITY_DN7970_c0_g1_i2.p1 TRINITY_DN7970_c0_g1~~TRINITY_DN7970_c0_g1_i2.p1  ORF type:complete len:374 (+),score=51.58 TRINITY_DN7970_c0_g1_i2:172-1293(+)